MTVPARLVAFAVACLAAFGLAFGVGRAGAGTDAVDPAPAGPAVSSDVDEGEGPTHDGTGHDSGTGG
jgi:hypothetical protein